MRKQKRPDPLVQALEERVPYTITIADGGDLASMRAVIKHGQTLTFSPVDDLAEIQVNDIVVVRWRGGSIMMHMVGEIRDDHFLIVNSLGKENGWVAGSAILGYVTQIIEPEPRPAVPNMLALLETAYQTVTERANLSEEEGLRLCSIAADMRWYAAKIKAEQWDQMPRLNLWSFEQHLWHLMKDAEKAAKAKRPASASALLNHGKEHVGQVATISTLLDAID